MSLPDYNRYFVAHQNSFTYKALDIMEAAGTDIIKGLDAFDAAGSALFRITVQGEMKAITIIPKIEILKLPVITAVLKDALAQSKLEIFNSKNLLPVVPLLIEHGADVSRSMQAAQENAGAMQRLLEITMNAKKIGLNQNLWANIGDLERAPKSGDPAKALLTVNGYTTYPMAYKVFGDWVVKMPPYIEYHGNNFVPADCSLAGQEQLNGMTLDMPLSNFRHDHDRARQRILGLQKIEFAQPK